MDKHTFQIGECPDCGLPITSAMFIAPCTVKCPNCNAESYAKITLISEREMRQEEDDYYNSRLADSQISIMKDQNSNDTDYLPF